MKKVHFACSIRSGRSDSKIYGELVEIIGRHAQVLSELFGSKSLMSSQHQQLSEQQIWAEDIEWLQQADAMIAEVTNPSLGVGYEVAKAEEWSIPVLALYRQQPGKKLSAMIAGSPKTKVAEYQNPADVEQTIVEFLK